MSKILVINNASEDVEVSINQWGKNGDTTYCKLTPSTSDEWNRTDHRGFVMYLDSKIGSLKGAYYVQAGTTVTIVDTKVLGVVKIPKTITS